MTTENNANTKRVLWDPNGEGLDFTDSNNAVLFQREELFNLLMSGAMADGLGDPSNPGLMSTPEGSDGNNALAFTNTDVVFAPFGGAGYVLPTGIARTVGITAGPLVVAIEEVWNATGEEFAMARASGGVTLQTAVGDATNPRIDLVEVKLSYVDGDPQDRHFEDAITREPTTEAGTNKERQIEAIYQIKQGTAAANPTYPAPTAGYVAMAAIYVPATHNAVHNPDNIRDLRVPFGVRAIDVDVNGFHFVGANPWTKVGMLASIAAGSVQLTANVIVPCPVATKSARLLAVGVHGTPGDDPIVQLVRINYPASGAPTITALANLSDDTVAQLYTANGLIFADAMDIADAIATHAVLKGIRQADTHIGTPIWCNGKTGGMAHQGTAGGAEAATTKLGILISGTGPTAATVAYVRFWIAEGV